MKNKIELKPCPFCGGEAMVIDTGDYFPVITYRVICKASCIMQGGLYKTKKKQPKHGTGERQTMNDSIKLKPCPFCGCAMEES